MSGRRRPRTAAPAPTPDPPVRRLGPYLLERELGRGGMGVVHAARHERTGEAVAIKTAIVAQPEALEGLRREVHALARLRHPQIARILDDGVAGGAPWYAMELVEGVGLRDHCRPLAARLAQGPEPARALETLLELFGRLCIPFAHMHGEGLVHRDVKPGNVIVRDGGVPCIIDFGLTRWSAGAASREVLQIADAAGTGAYMAPEQMRGEALDARADLYALGAMMFALLAGRAPFATTAEVMDPELSAPPLSTLVPVPRELDEILARLLAKRPELRLGYADDLGRALASLVEGSAPPPPARAYLYRARLAGRGELLAALDGFFARCPPGRGAFVMLGGESGIGKTRLAAEVGSRLAARGRTVRASSCPAGADGRTPLEAMARTIADHAGDAAVAARVVGPRAKILAALEPELVLLPGARELPDPDPLPPRESRHRLFVALLESLAALARERPLLWLVDDLHAADGATRDFLKLLATQRRLEQAPLSILATFRAEEGDALAPLRVAEGALMLSLGPLDDDAVRAIVGDMLALPDPAPRFVAALRTSSDGNPFFVGEYLRSALADGHLDRDVHGLWNVSARAAEDSAAWPVPREVRELVGRRLDRLAPAARGLATLAAALGRESEEAILRAASPLPEAAHMEALTELVARQVLEEPAPGALRFLHGQIRDAAYAMAAEGERGAVHRRCAEAMEGLGVERAAARASHWELAGDPARARRDFLAGARRSFATGAFPEAERLYRDHLRLAPAPDLAALDARQELAQRLLIPRGKPADALQELTRAHDEALQLGETARAPRLLMSMALATQAAARWEEARALYLQAREGFRARGDDRGLAELLHRQGDLDHQLGRPEAAREAYEEGLLVARRAGDGGAEGILCTGIGLLETSEGRIDEAAATLERAIELLRAAGNRQWEAIALGNLANLRLMRGDARRAMADYEGVLAVARRLGVRRMEAMALHNLATVRAEWGDLDEGIDRCRDAIEILRELEDRRSEAILENGLVGMLHARGDLEAALEVATRAAGKHRALGNRRWEADALHGLADIAEARGDLDEAQRLAREARDGADETGDALLAASTEITLARLVRRAGGDAGPHLRRADALVATAPDQVRALALCARAEDAAARGEQTDVTAIASAVGGAPVAPFGQLGRAIARLREAGLMLPLP